MVATAFTVQQALPVPLWEPDSPPPRCMEGAGAKEIQSDYISGESDFILDGGY